MPCEPLLTPKDAAEYLRIHEKSVIRLARKEMIPALRLGKHWRFRQADLSSWVEAQRQSICQPVECRRQKSPSLVLNIRKVPSTVSPARKAPTFGFTVGVSCKQMDLVFSGSAPPATFPSILTCRLRNELWRTCMRRVQELMRHANASTTMDLYQQADHQAKRAAQGHVSICS